MKKPSMLVVEDEERQLKRLVKLFRDSVRSMGPIVQRYGIEGFDVDAAATGAGALQWLGEANARARPYDVVLLDVHLPRDEDDPTQSLEVGKKLLDCIVEHHSANAVVVVSAYGPFEHLDVEMLKKGAMDFVHKPYREEPLVFAVMQAWEKAWYRLRNREQEKRFAWALEQSRGEIADRLTNTVTRHTSTLLGHSQHLKEYLEERYQLNLERDKDDPICRAVKGIEDAARSAAQECSVLRSGLGGEAPALSLVNVRQSLEEVTQKLHPALIFRRVNLELPDEGEGEIKTFRDDLRTVLEEVLFSAVDASAEQGTVKASITRSESALEVCVLDECEPLHSKVCDRIEKGEPMERAEGRGWGLSLAQRVARNMGARLEVRPLPERGNIVTLRLPVIPE